jgi:hypothetical protein
MLLIISTDWMLPGIYTPTYEFCSCIFQDHSQPSKFDNTTMFFPLTTLFINAIASIQINIYKHKIKSTVVQVDPNQSLQYKFPNKMMVDLSLTIGSVLLIMAISFFIYIISSTHATVDYTTVEYFYLLMMPISFNSVSVSFYLKNPNVRKIIF